MIVVVDLCLVGSSSAHVDSLRDLHSAQKDTNSAQNDTDSAHMGIDSAHMGSDSAHWGSESVHNGSNVDSDPLLTDIHEQNLGSGQHNEFAGLGNIPSYDVCPTLEKKTLLSDCWADIMTLGVGLQFNGGANEFKQQLIKYTTINGFKFKYARNDGKTNPNIGGKEVMTDFKNSYGIHIPYWKAWKTVESEKNKIWGSYDDSYDQLRWYCDAISSTNPGSVVSLEHNSETQCFERLFISFKTCIDGFKSYRPMLFVDGTLMKGWAKGLFPVAMAVVSAENTANWAWFLGKLRDNIKHEK
ncbi:hypothetical protein ACS0TY_004939 [Phlomoides rotata]